MIRLVWSVLVLVGCTQSQVVESSHSAHRTSTLGAASSTQQNQSVRFFAWSLRSKSAKNFDHFEQMDPQTQKALLNFLSLRDGVTEAEVSAALRDYSSTMMGATSKQANVIAHQGQLKHHDVDAIAGESQVIRSISSSKDLRFDGCYEMRKVFTESQPTAQWLSPDAAESWRRVGLTQTAPSAPSSLSASTKAFLLIDFVERVTRLYVYEESNGGEQSELTELVIACDIAPVNFVTE